ncbi:hypothetical protein Clacol_007371 [Clathrus columnatus]|uniref:Uncharacterized protein n=1 Tax=Clathrus columnatus TaxID=1419009 RepID=A0AAV5AJK4_9AGAM|nr:hypothetical protein Clacol_007371 [Clathrus columnatus]
MELEFRNSAFYHHSISRVCDSDVGGIFFGFISSYVELIFYANITGLIKPSIQTCQSWVRFEVISGHCLALSVDVLLAIRTHALYGRSRIMLGVLATILIISQGFGISILVRVIPNFVTTPLPLPSRIHIGACVVLAADPNFPNYLIPTLVTESSFFFLVLVKFIHSKVTTKTHTSHMLIVFLRDGLWAFALVFGVLVWSLVTYKVNPARGDIAITWLFSILAFSHQVEKLPM